MYKKIISEINKEGGNAYIVGGYVRDKILNIESKDIDIEVLNISEKDLEKILKKYNFRLVGKSYKVYIKDGIEISFPLINNKANPFISIEEAAKRRDFTINSVYYNVLNDKYIDNFNGIEDIKNKILKMTSKDSFLNDPLRILRLAQFKSRFNFNVEEETEKLSIDFAENLKLVSKERICIELEKILLKSEKPSIAFRWLKKTNILKVLLPEIDLLYGIEQGKKYHPEGDVFEHTMLSLDVLKKEEKNFKLMLAVLYHDIGKAFVENIPDGDNVHFYGHDKKGFEIVEEFLLKITDEKKIIEDIKKLILYHMHPIFFDKRAQNKKNIRKLASKVNVEELLLIHKADLFGKGINSERKEIFNEDVKSIDRIKEIYEEVKNEIKPIILGRHLIDEGLKPDNNFSKILNFMYEAQLDEKFRNLDEGIIFLKESLKKDNFLSFFE